MPSGWFCSQLPKSLCLSTSCVSGPLTPELRFSRQFRFARKVFAPDVDLVVGLGLPLRPSPPPQPLVSGVTNSTISLGKQLAGRSVGSAGLDNPWKGKRKRQEGLLLPESIPLFIPARCLTCFPSCYPHTAFLTFLPSWCKWWQGTTRCRRS